MNNAIHFVEMDEKIGFSKYEPMLGLLWAEKRDKILKFRFDIDKKLGMVSDLLTRYLACNYLEVNNFELRFETNKYGKPFLKGITDFHYNISHTRNAVVVVVSENPIGVDVEKVRAYESGIAKRFFGSKEWNYVKNNS